MSGFCLRRGKGYARRKAHLTKFDALGRPLGAWCERPTNLFSNVPWGSPTCKDCLRIMRKAMVSA